MISFVPESLQADIIESINDLHFLKGNIEEIEFSVFQKLEESADEYDCEISENSMVCLSVGEDDFSLISVREFLDMAKCKAHLKINDAQSYAKSCNEVYFLLDVRDYTLPGFVKGKQVKPVDESDCSALLEKIAEHIYSTRNEIAHAKANYEKRGTECPAREKASFCKMLEIIAIRCIRWFAIQPEEKRVVPHEK